MSGLVPCTNGPSPLVIRPLRFKGAPMCAGRRGVDRIAQDQYRSNMRILNSQLLNMQGNIAVATKDSLE